MSSETAPEVRSAIESYRAAFERLDAEAIADHFAYPSYIASDAEQVVLIPILDRQQCLAAMGKVIALHRKLGGPSGRICDLSILELSSRLVQASLKMEVIDDKASCLYDFEATYGLAKFSGAWRIITISHNQIPRLLECVEQRH